MQLVVDSLLISYERRGKGKVVLLVHGWGDSAKGLAMLNNELSKSYDVISIDLPGFGGSEMPHQPWGLTDFANMVGEFCKKLKLQPYAVIGHSNGGAVLIRALATDYIAADRLVLLASAGVRGQYKGRTRALRFITKTGKLLTTPLPKSVKRRLRKRVYSAVGSDMLVAEHLQETFKRVVRDDVRDDAAKIDTPTLLIYGENDESTPPEWGRKLQKAIKNSMFVLVPSAGHFVHTEAVEEVNQRVREFLK